MPSINEIDRTCRRLNAELCNGGAEPHRLLEIETIVRLLVPHLTRAVADAVHQGKANGLGSAGEQLVAIRSCLTLIAENREGGREDEGEEQLAHLVRLASQIVMTLQRL